MNSKVLRLAVQAAMTCKPEDLVTGVFEAMRLQLHIFSAVSWISLWRASRLLYDNGLTIPLQLPSQALDMLVLR